MIEKKKLVKRVMAAEAPVKKVKKPKAAGGYPVKLLEPDQGGQKAVPMPKAQIPKLQPKYHTKKKRSPTAYKGPGVG